MDKQALWKALGATLGRRRYGLGLTQQQVARRVGTSHATIGRIERGEDLPEDQQPAAAGARERLVEAIAAALDMSEDDRCRLLEPVRHRAAVHARVRAWAAADHRTAELVCTLLGDLVLDDAARLDLVATGLRIRRAYLARARAQLPVPAPDLQPRDLDSRRAS